MLKEKKTLDKGHPIKDLRIFCHHIWQNINRKSLFCWMLYFRFAYDDVLQ